MKKLSKSRVYMQQFKDAYSDEEIMSMHNVPPIIAGKYLGLNPQVVRIGVRSGWLPVGNAGTLNANSKRFVYVIPGPRLVAYKHGELERASTMTAD